MVLHLGGRCCGSSLDWESRAAVLALLLSRGHCLSPQRLTVSPEQLALLGGDSSEPEAAQPPGCPSPPGQCGQPWHPTRGDSDVGQSGFCAWLGRPCSCCAAQLQPRASRLVQEGLSSHRRHRAGQVWGVEQHR